MKILASILIFGASFSLVGCSHTVQTTLQERCILPPQVVFGAPSNADQKPCESSKRDGLTYFLPKKLVKVTLTRKAVPADQLKKLAKDFEDATSDAEKKAKDKKDADEAVKFAEYVLSKFSKDDTSGAKKLAQEQVDKAKLDLLGKTKSAEDATKKAAQALVDFNNRLMAGAGSKQTQDALEYAQSMSKNYFAAFDFSKQAEKKLAEANVLPSGTPAEQAARRAAIITATNNLAEANKLLADATQNMKDGISRLVRVIETSIETKVEKASARPFEDDLALTELPAVPDHKYTFVADVAHLFTREDQVSLATTSTGLLKSAKGITNDKTAEILRDAAKIGIMAATGIPFPFDKSSLDTPKIMESVEGQERDSQIPQPRECPDIPKPIFLTPFPDIENQPFVAEFIFDPSEHRDVLDLNAQLCQLKSRYLVAVRSLEKTPVDPGSDPESVLQHSKIGNDRYVDGLVYRRSLPYVIDLRFRWITKAMPVSCQANADSCDSANNAYDLLPQVFKKQLEVSSVRKSAQILIPNKGPISTVPFRAGWFVKSSSDVTFEDGYPSKIDIERPSEIHAFLQLPLQVIRDIIAVPTDLIKLKVDYSTQETQLLKQQASQVEAEDKLRKTIEDVQKARSESQSQNP